MPIDSIKEKAKSIGNKLFNKNTETRSDPQQLYTPIPESQKIPQVKIPAQTTQKPQQTASTGPVAANPNQNFTPMPKEQAIQQPITGTYKVQQGAMKPYAANDLSKQGMNRPEVQELMKSEEFQKELAGRLQNPYDKVTININNVKTQQKVNYQNAMVGAFEDLLINNVGEDQLLGIYPELQENDFQALAGLASDMKQAKIDGVDREREVLPLYEDLPIVVRNYLVDRFGKSFQEAIGLTPENKSKFNLDKGPLSPITGGAWDFASGLVSSAERVAQGAKGMLEYGADMTTAGTQDTPREQTLGGSINKAFLGAAGGYIMAAFPYAAAVFSVAANTPGFRNMLEFAGTTTHKIADKIATLPGIRKFDALLEPEERQEFRELITFAGIIAIAKGTQKVRQIKEPIQRSGPTGTDPKLTGPTGPAGGGVGRKNGVFKTISDVNYAMDDFLMKFDKGVKTRLENGRKTLAPDAGSAAEYFNAFKTYVSSPQGKADLARQGIIIDDLNAANYQQFRTFLQTDKGQMFGQAAERYIQQQGLRSSGQQTVSDFFATEAKTQAQQQAAQQTAASNPVNQGFSQPSGSPMTRPTTKDILTPDVKKNIQLGVANTIRNLKTGPQREQMTEKFAEGFSTILDNRDMLSLSTEYRQPLFDETGNIIVENITNNNLSQAIFETKMDVWATVEKALKAEGVEMAVVDTKDIVENIRIDMQKMKLSDGTVAPGQEQVLNYLVDTLNKFIDENGQLIPRTISDLQKISQRLNAETQAYYEKRTTSDPVLMAAKAGLNHIIRPLIDEAVENIAGFPGLSDLKRRYGALTSIEAPITKRAQVIDRQPPKGLLGSFGDLMSAYEIGGVIFNLLTLNITGAVTGALRAAIVKGVSQHIKNRNDRDKSIAKAFTQIDKNRQGFFIPGGYRSIQVNPKQGADEGGPKGSGGPDVPPTKPPAPQKPKEKFPVLATKEQVKATINTIRDKAIDAKKTIKKERFESAKENGTLVEDPMKRKKGDISEKGVLDGGYFLSGRFEKVLVEGTEYFVSDIGPVYRLPQKVDNSKGLKPKGEQANTVLDFADEMSINTKTYEADPTKGFGMIRKQILQDGLDMLGVKTLEDLPKEFQDRVVEIANQGARGDMGKLSDKVEKLYDDWKEYNQPKTQSKGLQPKQTLTLKIEKDGQGQTVGGSDTGVSTITQEVSTQPRIETTDPELQQTGGTEIDTTTTGTRSGTTDTKTQGLSKKQMEENNKEVVKILTTKNFSQNPKDYTAEEIQKMKMYEGGGGLQKGDGEVIGSLDEFYTPTKIINDMWSLAKKHGYSDGATVLEPSAGVGRIISNKPVWTGKPTGHEIDKVSGTIASVLNPEATIKIGDFQDVFMDFTGTNPLSAAQIAQLPKYDVVIGNPPYKLRDTKQRKFGDLPKVDRFEDYFMVRGAQLLNEGGVMTMIVPSSFLDKGNSVAKDLISETGTELVEAYRLPNGVFPNTDVGTDILVFKKTGASNPEILSNSAYFEKNPNNILGEVGERTNRFGKMEKYVKGSIDDVKIKDNKSLSDFGGVLTVKPNNQLKFNQGDYYEPVRLVVNDKDAKVARYGALRNKDIQSFSGKTPLTQGEKLEMKRILQELGIDDKTATARHKFLKDEAKKVRSSTEQVIHEINDSFRQQKTQATKQPEPQGLFAVPTTPAGLKPKTQAVSQTVSKPKPSTPKPISTAKTETVVLNKTNINADDLDAIVKYQDNKDVFGAIQGVEYTENPKLLNYMDGETYLNYDYFSGDVFQKLNQLELDKNSITPEQYEKQKKGLEARMPEQQSIENIHFIPYDNPDILDMKTGEMQSRSKYNPDTKRSEDFEHDLSVKGMFEQRLRNHIPDRARTSSYEIRNFINKGRVEKDRKGMIMEDSIYYFNRFMQEGLPKNVQETIVETHNKKHRNIIPLDTTQIPLVIKDMSPTFRGQPLVLKQVQIDSILKASQKGAFISALGVGYGKTMVGVITTVQSMQQGLSKRPVIVIPGQTKKGRISTIQGLFPNYKINDLGTLDLPTRAKLMKELGKDTSKWIDDGTITIITHSAFENQIAFKPKTQDQILKDFLDDMATDDMTDRQMEAMLESTKSDIAAAGTTKTKLKSDFSMYDKERLGEQFYNMLQMPADQFKEQFIATATTDPKISALKVEEFLDMKPIYFEDLGFDAITVDELHNFKNVFAKAKIEDTDGKKDKNMYGDVQGSTSKRGTKMTLATNYILKNNNGRNVLGLTATPFNNQAIEVYNMLNFVGRARLKKLGISNMNTFMSKFSDFREMEVITPSGNSIAYRMIQKSFSNLKDLQNLINEFIDFKGDDPDIIKPALKTEVVKLKMSQKQQEVQTSIEERIDSNAEKGDVIGGMQEARANVISPYFTNAGGRPASPAQFLADSPKLDFFADMIIEKRALGNKDGAIIFLPMGIEYHEMLKTALAQKIGIPESKIGIINGIQKFKNKLQDTANKFNEGEIEILIGGSNINEGIDLQHNTYILYDTLLGRNPTVKTQKIGRGWRQGNMRNYVNYVLPLMENSVDSVMLQKMEEKQSRINDIFNYEGEVFSTEDIDPAEEKIALITNPVKKAEISINIDKKRLEKSIEIIKGDISDLERHKANLFAEVDEIPRLMELLERYEAGGQYATDEMKKSLKKDIQSLQQKAKRSRERIEEKNINPAAELPSRIRELEQLQEELANIDKTLEQRVQKYRMQRESEQQSSKDKQYYINNINQTTKDLRVFKNIDEQSEFKKGLQDKGKGLQQKQEVTNINSKILDIWDSVPTSSTPGLGYIWDGKYGKSKVMKQDGNYYLTLNDKGEQRNYSVKGFDTMVQKDMYSITEEGKDQSLKEKTEREQSIINENIKNKEIEEKKNKEIDLVKDFANTKDKLNSGKAIQTLLNNIRYKGVVMSKGEFMRTLLKEGLETSTREVNKIKDMSSRQYNLASNAQQEDHEKRIIEGGKKTEYYVGGYEVTKTEYDYFNYLKSNQNNNKGLQPKQ